MKPAAFLPLLIACCHSLLAAPTAITVSGAISLKAPLETLKPSFEKENPGIEVIYNFGSSGSLQQQIANGAPVDVFISAAAKQMDELEAGGFILPESRFVLASNSLVLVAPKGSADPSGFAQLASPSVKTISVGEPKSVPAGMYAQQIFAYFGIAEALKDKLVFAKDVSQVLTYVKSGNADAGVVYGSDVTGSDSVRVAEVAPDASHAKVEYPAAVIRASGHHAESGGFLRFLRSQGATEVFRKAGFVVPVSP